MHDHVQHVSDDRTKTGRDSKTTVGAHLASLGIDATNITSGGGLTHLTQLLHHFESSAHGFDRLTVWGDGDTLERLPANPRINRACVARKRLGPLQQMHWRNCELTKLAGNHCDVLFAPGGIAPRSTLPTVSMSQNMLPFDSAAIRQYPIGMIRARLNSLRYLQAQSFSRAAGLIFISEFARRHICTIVPKIAETPSCVVYHGVDDRFCSGSRKPDRSQRFSFQGPFRLLYVSQVTHYKHQWNVMQAVHELRSEGLPVRLHLVGALTPAARSRFERAKRAYSDCFEYDGFVPHDEIHRAYQLADGFIFASTCENMPNILVEAMQAGLPMAVSNYGPMPEVAGDAAIYFDPLSIYHTKQVVTRLVTDASLRSTLSTNAANRSQSFSWHKSADETFSFLRTFVNDHRGPTVIENSKTG